MKQLLKTTSAISITEIVLMFVLLFKNKYLAVAIGPEGFGVYGLLLSFFNLCMVFSGTWLSTGAVKYISEYNKEGDKTSTQKVYSFTIGLTTIISIVLTITFLLLNNQIRELLLTKEVLSIYFMLFSLSFIGNSLRPVFIALLQGLKKVKAVVQARIIISLFEVFSIFLLVFFYELIGFFISILASSIFSIAIFLYKFNQAKFKLSLKFSLYDDISKKLILFGGVNIILSLANLGSQFFHRKIILDKLDLVSVGLLQAAVAIRNYSDIIGRGSGFYFYPRMSEKLSKKIRSKEINNYIFFSIGLYTLIGVFIILFQENIVRLLLSKEFVPVIAILPWFIIAEYLHNFERPLGQAIVGMASLKIHALNSLIFISFGILIPLFLVGLIGIKSIALGAIIGFFLIITISIIYLYIKINLIINIRNITMSLGGLITLVFVSYYSFSLPIKIVLLICIVTTILITLTRNERANIIKIIGDLKNKFHGRTK